MENHERYEAQEIQGFAEVIRHDAPRATGIHHELHDDRRVMVVESFLRESGPLLWFSVLAQIGGYALKALMLIFHKLDSIETLLIQQEMRERAKEGR